MRTQKMRTNQDNMKLHNKIMKAHNQMKRTARFYLME